MCCTPCRQNPKVSDLIWSGLSVAFGLYWNAIVKKLFLWIRKANSSFPPGQLPAADIFWFLTSWGAAFFVSEISKNTGCFISEWQTNSSTFLSTAELRGVSLGTGALAWSKMWSYKPAFPGIFRWPHETIRKVWKSWFYNNISYLSWHLNHIVQVWTWEFWLQFWVIFLQISFSKFPIIIKHLKPIFKKLIMVKRWSVKAPTLGFHLLFPSYHFCIKFIQFTRQTQIFFHL